MKAKLELAKSPSPFTVLAIENLPVGTTVSSDVFFSVTAVDFWSAMVKVGPAWSPTVNSGAPQVVRSGVAEAVEVSSLSVSTVPVGKVPGYVVVSPLVTFRVVWPPVRSALTVPGALQPG